MVLISPDEVEGGGLGNVIHASSNLVNRGVTESADYINLLEAL